MSHRHVKSCLISQSVDKPPLGGSLPLALAIGLLLAITSWAYWPVTVDLLNVWRNSEDYSAGQLVPLVAIFLIWRERDTLKHCVLAPCWWTGVLLLLFAQAARIYGYGFSWRPAVGRYSLVLTVAGLVLLVAGRQVFHRLSWIMLFLLLMFPLPGRVHNLISLPLQNFATTGSVFLLEVAGVPVEQQGNVIMLDDHMPIAVAEACSGLRMLTAFIIVSAFVAYMVKRSRLKKGILLLSSLPVAVFSNTIRIFLTAVVMLYVSVEVGEKFFHDFAGVVMMPAAVVLIFALLWLMDRLATPDTDTRPNQVISRSRRAMHGGPQSVRRARGFRAR